RTALDCFAPLAMTDNFVDSVRFLKPDADFSRSSQPNIKAHRLGISGPAGGQCVSVIGSGEITDISARLAPAALYARARAWLADASDHSAAQRAAGVAFLIRVASAVLVYFSQVLIARWIGQHEFGIYVYVWTWVLLIGALADFGLASAAQRFI